MKQYWGLLFHYCCFLMSCCFLVSLLVLSVGASRADSPDYSGKVQGLPITGNPGSMMDALIISGSIGSSPTSFSSVFKLPEVPAGTVPGQFCHESQYTQTSDPKYNPDADLPDGIRVDPIHPESQPLDMTAFKAGRQINLTLNRPDGQLFNLHFFYDDHGQPWLYPEKMEGVDIDISPVFIKLTNYKEWLLLSAGSEKVELRWLPTLTDDSDDELGHILDVTRVTDTLTVFFRNGRKEWQVKLNDNGVEQEMTLAQYLYQRKLRFYMLSLYFENLLSGMLGLLPDHTRGWNTPGAMIPPNRVRQSPSSKHKKKSRTEVQDRQKEDSDEEPKAQAQRPKTSSFQPIGSSRGTSSKGASPKANALQQTSGQKPMTEQRAKRTILRMCENYRKADTGFMEKYFTEFNFTASSQIDNVDFLTAALTTEKPNSKVLSFLLKNSPEMLEPSSCGSYRGLPPVIHLVRKEFGRGELIVIREKALEIAREQLNNSVSAGDWLNDPEFNQSISDTYPGSDPSQLKAWLSLSAHNNVSDRIISDELSEEYLSAEEGESPASLPPTMPLPGAIAPGKAEPITKGKNEPVAAEKAAPTALEKAELPAPEKAAPSAPSEAYLRLQQFAVNGLKEDEKQVFKELLETIDPDEVDKADNEGKTPLWVASREGRYQIVTGLLRQSRAAVNVNARDNNEGNTALFQAASKGFSMISEVLLEHHADHRLLNNEGASPLVIAVENEHTDCVKMLLKFHACPHHGRIEQLCPFELCLQKLSGNERPGINTMELANILFRAAPDTPWRLNELAQPRQDPDQLAKTLSRVKYIPRGFNGVHRMIQFALEPDSVLGYLKIWLDSPVGNTIRDARDENGQTLLMLACSTGAKQCVNLLIDRKAAIDAQDNTGDTALMIAIKNGKAGIVNTLLLAGATTFRRNRHNGYSALELAQKIATRDHGKEYQRILQLLNKQSRLPQQDGDKLIELLGNYLAGKEPPVLPSSEELKEQRMQIRKKIWEEISQKTKFTPAEEELQGKLDKAHERIANLETRVHDLTLSQHYTEPVEPSDLTYLERKRLEEEYIKIKELKRKAEQFAIEAKQVSQRLSAENFTLKEKVSTLKSHNELWVKNMGKELEDALSKVKTIEPIMATRIEVLEQKLASRLKSLAGSQGESLPPEVKWSTLPKITLKVSGAFAPHVLKTVTERQTGNQQGIPPDDLRMLQLSRWKVGDPAIPQIKVEQTDTRDSLMAPPLQILANAWHRRTSTPGDSGDPDPQPTDIYFTEGWDHSPYGPGYFLAKMVVSPQKKPKGDHAVLITAVQEQMMGILLPAFQLHPSPGSALAGYKKLVLGHFQKSEPETLHPADDNTLDWQQLVGYHGLITVSEMAVAVTDAQQLYLTELWTAGRKKERCRDPGQNQTHNQRTSQRLKPWPFWLKMVGMPGLLPREPLSQLTTLGPNIKARQFGLEIKWGRSALAYVSTKQPYTARLFDGHQYTRESLRRLLISQSNLELINNSFEKNFLPRMISMKKRYDQYEGIVSRTLDGVTGSEETKEGLIALIQTEKVPPVLLLRDLSGSWLRSPVPFHAPMLGHIVLPWLENLVSQITRTGFSLDVPDESQAHARTDEKHRCREFRELLLDCAVAGLDADARDHLLTLVEKKQAELPTLNESGPVNFDTWRQQVISQYHKRSAEKKTHNPVIDDWLVEKILSGKEIMEQLLRGRQNPRPLVRQLSAAALAGFFGVSLNEGWQLLRKMEFTNIDTSGNPPEPLPPGNTLASQYFLLQLYTHFHSFLEENIFMTEILFRRGAQKKKEGTVGQSPGSVASPKKGAPLPMSQDQIKLRNQFFSTVNELLLKPLAEEYAQLTNEDEHEIARWLLSVMNEGQYTGIFVDWFDQQQLGQYFK